MSDSKESNTLEVASVLSCSRRNAELLTSSNEIIKSKIQTGLEEPCVGDLVNFKKEEDYYFIVNILARKNCFYRTYRKKEKVIAANLDHLFLVTARGPLFNTSFIDRVLCLAEIENIPVSLLLNKSDISSEESEEQIKAYLKLGYQLLETSALTENGIMALLDFIRQEDFAVLAFTGVSGVGKSSILNAMLGEELIKTQTTSEKTGQGKQTTSQARGYLFELKEPPQVLIDLPGIQNFGLAHLEKQEIAFGFREFILAREKCEYYDCMHLEEPNCAVKAAVQAEEIAKFRYESYIKIIAEIEANREY